MRKSITSVALVAQLTFSLLSVAPPSHAAASSHKLFSPHYIVTELEEHGLAVIDVRRKAQIYFVHVTDGEGEAIIAINGASAKVIGITPVTLLTGAKPKPRHPRAASAAAIVLTAVYGYEVTVETYESYVEITETEITSETETYEEYSYEESEEIEYTETEESEEIDLDEEEESSAEEVIEDDAGDDASDEAADDASDDDGADDADDGADDDVGEEDGGGDDGGEEE